MKPETEREKKPDEKEQEKERGNKSFPLISCNEMAGGLMPPPLPPLEKRDEVAVVMKTTTPNFRNKQ